MANLNPSHATKQILAGYSGIIFGALGIHKFILGYSLEGVVMVTISVAGLFFAYGLPCVVMQFVGLVEGMIYLNKSHDEFVDTYFIHKQGWF